MSDSDKYQRLYSYLNEHSRYGSRSLLPIFQMRSDPMDDEMESFEFI